MHARNPLELLKGDITGDRREVIPFVAGLLDDAEPLLRAALKRDKSLALDIIGAAKKPPRLELVYPVAAHLFTETVEASFIGAGKSWGRKFLALAKLYGKDPEDLAKEALPHSVKRHLRDVAERAFLQSMLEFYQNMQDDDKVASTFVRLGVNVEDDADKLDKDVLFEAAVSAPTYERTIELYSQFLLHEPQNLAALSNRANAYLELDETEKAESDWKLATADVAAASPNSIQRYCQFLAQQGRPDEAVALFTKALTHAPNNRILNKGLADLLLASDPRKALEHYLIAQKFGQKCLSELAAVYKRLEMHEGEMSTVRRLISGDPTSAKVPEWRRRIGELRRLSEQAKETQTVFDRLRGQVRVFSLSVVLIQTSRLPICLFWVWYALRHCRSTRWLRPFSSAPATAWTPPLPASICSAAPSAPACRSISSCCWSTCCP